MTKLDEKTSVPIGWVAVLVSATLTVGFFFWDARADGKLANQRLDKLEPSNLRLEKAVYRLEVNSGTLPDDYKPPWDEDEITTSPKGQKKRKR